jgi:hypothetical protein
MSSLFLLDRNAQSVSFEAHPDPQSTVWFDFPMLELPIQKFGGLENIPQIELVSHLKNDIKVAHRAIQSTDPNILISSGRACLIHSELIMERAWKGLNVFIDFQGDIKTIPKKVLKHSTLVLSSEAGCLVGTNKIDDQKEEKFFLNTSIPSFKLAEYIQDHFY